MTLSLSFLAFHRWFPRHWSRQTLWTGQSSPSTLYPTLTEFHKATTYYTISIVVSGVVTRYRTDSLYELLMCQAVENLVMSVDMIVAFTVEALAYESLETHTRGSFRTMLPLALGFFSFLSVFFGSRGGLDLTRAIASMPNGYSEEQCLAYSTNPRYHAVLKFLSSAAFPAGFVSWALLGISLCIPHPRSFKVYWMTTILALILSTWLLLASIYQMRIQLQRLVGESDEQEQWTIGQMIALFTWLPVPLKYFSSLLGNPPSLCHGTWLK